MLNVLVAAVLIQGLVQGNPQPQHLWAIALPDDVRAFAIAQGANCVTASTRSRAFVFGINGETLWETTLPEPVDDMVTRGTIVVAPSCDWVAVWTGTNSPHVQVLSRNGLRQVVPLAITEGDQVERRTWTPRVLDISSDGEYLVVGTEFDHLAIITKDGVLRERIRVSELGTPVVAQFAPASPLLIVTGDYAVGVARLDGSWAWRREVSLAQIAANRDQTSFAGRFVTSHGPAVGTVEMLGVSGKTRWKRNNIWDPAIAVAPNGSFVAFSGSGVGYDNQWPVSDGHDRVWLVDRNGRTLIRRDISGRVDQISDGQCIILREPALGNLVGRDVRLREVWRLDVAGGSDPVFLRSSSAVVIFTRGRLEAYGLPTCRISSAAAGASQSKPRPRQ